MAEAATAEAIRQKVLSESGGRCCVCAAHTGFQVEVVPVVPLSDGGEYVANNLAALCAFCRWLLTRQKLTPAVLKTRRKQWLVEVRKAPQTFRESGLTIHGHPLRLEAVHHKMLTVLEGSELNSLLANFFNCLDTFLVHEDQHLENAISLAVIRAFRDQYNYVPPEQDIKDQSTADSRKLDLLYRSIRALFSAGLSAKPAEDKSSRRAASGGAKRRPASSRKIASRKPTARKKPLRKPAASPAKRKRAAARKPAPHGRRRG